MSNLHKALDQCTTQQIEATEDRIRELRREASRRLELISPNDDENLLTLCGLVFGILALQDDLNRERHRLEVFGR